MALFVSEELVKRALTDMFNEGWDTRYGPGLYPGDLHRKIEVWLERMKQKPVDNPPFRVIY